MVLGGCKACKWSLPCRPTGPLPGYTNMIIPTAGSSTYHAHAQSAWCIGNPKLTGTTGYVICHVWWKCVITDVYFFWIGANPDARVWVIRHLCWREGSSSAHRICTSLLINDGHKTEPVSVCHRRQNFKWSQSLAGPHNIQHELPRTVCIAFIPTAISTSSVGRFHWVREIPRDGGGQVVGCSTCNQQC